MYLVSDAYKEAMREPIRNRGYISVVVGDVTYDNSWVIDSSLDKTVSDTNEHIFQSNFWVRLKNENGYFDYENPESAVYSLEYGQQVVVSYGLELDDGTIEWVKGATLVLSDWEIEDEAMVLRAVDIIQTLTTPRRSFWYQPTRVLQDNSIRNAYVPSSVDNAQLLSPTRLYTDRDILQMYASATNTILWVDRDGIVRFDDALPPDVTVTYTSQWGISRADRIIGDAEVRQYATFERNYSRVDGSFYVMDVRGTDGQSYTKTADSKAGYIFNTVAPYNGNVSFDVDLSPATPMLIHNVVIDFGENPPVDFEVGYMPPNGAYTYVSFTGNTSSVVTVPIGDVGGSTPLVISILIHVSKAIYGTRVRINKVRFNDANGFELLRDDMTETPIANKPRLISTVNVPYYINKTASDAVRLITETVTVNSVSESEDRIYIFDTTYASLGYDGSLPSGMDMIHFNGSYWMTGFSFLRTGTFAVNVKGYPFTTEQVGIQVNTLGEKGEVVEWSNPLLPKSLAPAVADYLALIYQPTNLSYTLDNRGFPELDVLDVITQEGYSSKFTARVLSQTFKFNGRFSAVTETRKFTYQPKGIDGGQIVG